MFILFIILIIIIIYFSLPSNHKWGLPSAHKFWDKQNVSRNYSINGNISNIHINNSVEYSEFKIDNININYKNKLIIFKNFINIHYITGYYYTNELLNWLLKNVVCLGLFQKNNLIGTITNKDIVININNNIIKCGYADFLCINKTYRNNYYAPLLISNLIQRFNSKYCFIFKKENSPLPFDYITKFNYYIYELDNNHYIDSTPTINLKLVTLDDLDIVYEFYQENIKCFKMSLSFKNKLEFKNIYLNNPELVFTFIYKMDNKIINLLSFYLCNIDYHGVRYKIAELLFSFNEINNTEKIINYLKIFLRKKSINYLSIPGLGNNFNIISQLPIVKGKICYLQMYNYGLKTKLLPSEVFFPLP